MTNLGISPIEAKAPFSNGRLRSENRPPLNQLLRRKIWSRSVGRVGESFRRITANIFLMKPAALMM